MSAEGAPGGQTHRRWVAQQPEAGTNRQAVGKSAPPWPRAPPLRAAGAAGSRALLERAERLVPDLRRAARAREALRVGHLLAAEVEPVTSWALLVLAVLFFCMCCCVVVLLLLRIVAVACVVACAVVLMCVLCTSRLPQLKQKAESTSACTLPHLAARVARPHDALRRPPVDGLEVLDRVVGPDGALGDVEAQRRHQIAALAAQIRRVVAWARARARRAADARQRELDGRRRDGVAAVDRQRHHQLLAAVELLAGALFLSLRRPEAGSGFGGGAVWPCNSNGALTRPPPPPPTLLLCCVCMDRSAPSLPPPVSSPRRRPGRMSRGAMLISGRRRGSSARRTPAGGGAARGASWRRRAAAAAARVALRPAPSAAVLRHHRRAAPRPTVCCSGAPPHARRHRG